MNGAATNAVHGILYFHRFRSRIHDRSGLTQKLTVDQYHGPESTPPRNQPLLVAAQGQRRPLAAMGRRRADADENRR